MVSGDKLEHERGQYYVITVISDVLLTLQHFTTAVCQLIRVAWRNGLFFLAWIIKISFALTLTVAYDDNFILILLACMSSISSFLQGNFGGKLSS